MSFSVTFIQSLLLSLIVVSVTVQLPLLSFIEFALVSRLTFVRFIIIPVLRLNPTSAEIARLDNSSHSQQKKPQIYARPDYFLG